MQLDGYNGRGGPIGATARVQRLLTAIVALTAGYSRLMGVDEEGTLAAMQTHLRECAYPIVAEHGGRVVKATGDGFLAEFPSIVEAVHG